MLFITATQVCVRIIGSQEYCFAGLHDNVIHKEDAKAANISRVVLPQLYEDMSILLEQFSRVFTYEKMKNVYR